MITLESAVQTEYVPARLDTSEERVASVTATRIIFIIRQPKRANRKCEEKYFQNVFEITATDFKLVIEL